MSETASDSSPAAQTPGRTAINARAVVGAMIADDVLVIAFAAIGRASHDEGILGPSGLGLVQTAWPFLVALAAGWVISRGWRRPTDLLRTGVPVWAVTVAGGMVLRAVSGQGVQLAFVIVAALTLAVFLLGWRAIIRTLPRRALR